MLNGRSLLLERADVASSERKNDHDIVSVIVVQAFEIEELLFPQGLTAVGSRTAESLASAESFPRDSATFLAAGIACSNVIRRCW